MANISPKFVAKLLMVFQYSFQIIEKIIEMFSYLIISLVRSSLVIG